MLICHFAFFYFYFRLLISIMNAPSNNTDCLTDIDGNLNIFEGDSVSLNKFDFLDSNEDVTTFLLCTNEFGDECDLDVYAYVILNPEHDLTPGEYV